jgi:phage shock protein PspC (stress-responsive transcriptional regulator)
MTTETSFQPETPSIVRPRHRRMIAGVAAGVADYLGVDPTVIRIVFVVLTFVGGTGLPLYLAGWLLIPDPDRGSIAGSWLHPGDQPSYDKHRAAAGPEDRRPDDLGAQR